MKGFLKTSSLIALAAAASAKNYKRDPYWIKMSDVINQVRPDFYFGVATTQSFFQNPKYKDIISTFNLHVGGNECKMYTINSAAEGQYDYSKCNSSINYAKKMGAKYRGHNLFWPTESPGWLKSWEHADDSEMVKEYILDYITKVLETYKDDEDIIYWDVINESVTDDSTETNIKLKTGSDKDTLFKGWGTYTEDIFKLAREHLNPNVKLFYNDYNAENNNGNFKGKTGAVYNYVKNMREKGVPIDGVGLQMHISCNYYPNYEQLYTLISKYEEIGVEVHITEIDVSMDRCQTVEEQTKLYMDVFKACFDHPSCTVFTLWGAYDTESWKGAENEPLIFDDDMYPKPVYFDMLKYVMDQLPADATYPIPTSTVRPQPTEEPTLDENTLMIVKKDSFMVDSSWQNWSWGTEFVFDDDSNLVATTSFGSNGGLSFKSNVEEEHGGKFYFDIMTNDTTAPINVIFHGRKAGFITMATLEDVPETELKSYVLEIPKIEDDVYYRITFQDVTGVGLIMTLNNVYYTQEIEEEETPSGSVTYTIIKPDDFMINTDWQNWSWSTTSEFDESGSIVAQTTAGGYGGLSFKKSAGEFGAGTLYFKAMTNDTTATIQILFHTTADEYVSIAQIKNTSETEMTQYSIEVAKPTAELYNRITFQDGSSNGLTIYLNDVYYTEIKEAEVPTPTDTTTYSIIKDGESKISSEWQNWSWATESEFDEDGNIVAKTTADSYGALSFKKSSGEFGAGTLYFKAMTNDTTATLQILFHTTADEYVGVGQITDISDSEMTQYSVEVTNSDEAFNRISFQDASSKGLTLYLNDVYYEAINVEKPTTTTTEPTSKPTVQPNPDFKFYYQCVNPKHWAMTYDDGVFKYENSLMDLLKEYNIKATFFIAGTVYTDINTPEAEATIKRMHAEGHIIGNHSYNHLDLATLTEEELRDEIVKLEDVIYKYIGKRPSFVRPPFGSGRSDVEVNKVLAELGYKAAVIWNADSNDWKDSGDIEATIEKALSVINPVIKSGSSIITLNHVTTTYRTEQSLLDLARAEIELILENGYTPVTMDECLGLKPYRDEPEEPTTTAVIEPTTTVVTEIPTEQPTTTTTTVEPTETPVEDCWSDVLGYSCCKYTTAVITEDASGKWGVEDGQWCGLIESAQSAKCWSIKLGYPCCQNTSVIYDIDLNGSWGYENDSWCGIAQVDGDCEFNSLGYTCCPENKVVLEDDHKWGVSDGQWCGVEF